MDKPDPAVGWDCYDDEGEKIAWFLHFDDAVLWLAERERAGDPRQSQADPTE